MQSFKAEDIDLKRLDGDTRRVIARDNIEILLAGILDELRKMNSKKRKPRRVKDESNKDSGQYRVREVNTTKQTEVPFS